jgi:hypothetical protein
MPAQLTHRPYKKNPSLHNTHAPTLSRLPSHPILNTTTASSLLISSDPPPSPSPPPPRPPQRPPRRLPLRSLPLLSLLRSLPLSLTERSGGGTRCGHGHRGGDPRPPLPTAGCGFLSIGRCAPPLPPVVRLSSPSGGALRSGGRPEIQ